MIEGASMKYGILKENLITPVDESQGLPVVEAPPPDSLEYGYKAVAHYEQKAGQIVKVWEIQPWTEQDWQYAREAEVQVAGAESSSEVGSDT